jgi:hypothetical protein
MNKEVATQRANGTPLQVIQFISSPKSLFAVSEQQCARGMDWGELAGVKVAADRDSVRGESNRYCNVMRFRKSMLIRTVLASVPSRRWRKVVVVTVVTTPG